MGEMMIGHTSLAMSTYLEEQKIIVVGSLIYHVSGKRLHGPTERLIQLKASRRKSIEHERRKAGIYIRSIEHLFSNTVTYMHTKYVLAERFEGDRPQIKCTTESYALQTLRYCRH